MSIKVATSITGEGAVGARMGPHTHMSQHVTFLVCFANKHAPTNAAQVAHLPKKIGPQSSSSVSGKQHLVLQTSSSLLTKEVTIKKELPVMNGTAVPKFKVYTFFLSIS